MADELDDMLVRMIIRKAPSVKPEEAAEIAGALRALLRSDRAIVVDHICKQLDLYSYAGAAERVRRTMEKYND